MIAAKHYKRYFSAQAAQQLDMISLLYNYSANLFMICTRNSPKQFLPFIQFLDTDDDFDSEGLCFRYSVWHPVRDSLKCSGKVLRYSTGLVGNDIFVPWNAGTKR